LAAAAQAVILVQLQILEADVGQLGLKLLAWALLVEPYTTKLVLAVQHQDLTQDMVALVKLHG
jgi:hypothetical protein